MSQKKDMEGTGWKRQGIGSSPYALSLGSLPVSPRNLDSGHDGSCNSGILLHLYIVYFRLMASVLTLALSLNNTNRGNVHVSKQGFLPLIT
jgi:hypothetical protein